MLVRINGVEGARHALSRSPLPRLSMAQSLVQEVLVPLPRLGMTLETRPPDIADLDRPEFI